MSRKKTLNLHRDQSDWRGRALCPLADEPFSFDDCLVRTIDGFMYTLMLPANDNRRIITLMEDAAKAKRTVRHLTIKNDVRWRGETIKVNSREYEVLIERMLRARFRKDRRAIAALAASRDLKLVHKRPHPKAQLGVIPPKKYCAILSKLRKELLSTGEISKVAA